MKIKLFTHNSCVKCRSLKKLLYSILPDFGLRYETAVMELNVEDSNTLADLTMLNAEFLPTMNIGDAVLTGERIMNEGVLRAFIKDHIKLIE